MDEVKKAFLVLVATTVLCFLALGGLALWFYLDSKDKIHQIEKGRFDARYALCTEDNKVKIVERKRLLKDIQRSDRFLKKNPNGTKDFSRDLILEARQDSVDARNSLALGKCKQFASNPTPAVPTR